MENPGDEWIGARIAFGHCGTAQCSQQCCSKGFKGAALLPALLAYTCRICDEQRTCLGFRMQVMQPLHPRLMVVLARLAAAGS